MMKIRRILKVVACLVIMSMVMGSCNRNKNSDEAFQGQLKDLYLKREFNKVEDLVSRMDQPISAELKYLTDSLVDYMDRFRKEFPLTEQDVINRLKDAGIDCSNSRIRGWEKLGQLEYLVMDGMKHYFKNAPYNLVLLNDSLANVAGVEGFNSQDLGDFCVAHINEVLDESKGKRMGSPVCAEKFFIDYTLKVLPGSVTPGSVISAWLPFGVRNSARQSGVKLVESAGLDFKISPEDCPHQTVFLRKMAYDNGGVEFSITSEFICKAQYFEPQRLLQSGFVELPDTVLPFVTERAPHILFSESIRQLADSLTNDSMQPFEMVRQFYYWMDAHIPWARAIEYGLMDNIPQYTLDKMHGDCGMQTLLFMTLCRYKGIPARWQSGWMLHRGNVNLHDWCEVWYAGVGWVPVDVSFKLQNNSDQRVREFYISGMDAFRLAVNTDYGRVLCPSKVWPRSEPLDFQRGEVEWERGNLYFDSWTYKMGVTYLD